MCILEGKGTPLTLFMKNYISQTAAKIESKLNNYVHLSSPQLLNSYENDYKLYKERLLSFENTFVQIMEGYTAMVFLNQSILV